MKAIIRNGKVIEVIRGYYEGGLPIDKLYNIPEHALFYHIGPPIYEILKTKVKEDRVISPYPLEYCKSLIKEELRKQRVLKMDAGFVYEGNEFHSDSTSLTMIKMLPSSIPIFKHKNGWVPLPDTSGLKLAVDEHVQGLYGWEAVESMTVDNMSSFEELVEYYDVLSK